MNKQEFLDQLSIKLSNKSKDDLKQILEYYDEMISDGVENGKNEETVISELDKPEEIADKILQNSKEFENTNTVDFPGDYSSSGNDLTKIIIEAENIPIELHQTSGNKVLINYNKTMKEDITVTEQNGVFTFSHRIKRTILLIMGAWPFRNRIIVQIPKNFNGDLQVVTNNARIIVNPIKNVNIMQLKTSNAKIESNGCIAYKLDIKTSNASINVSNNYSKICSLISSNGRISLYNDIFETQCLAETGNASINCDSLTSDNVSLTTSNGSIQGTIIGDAREYSIKSKTSNASNNLPSDWAFENQVKRLFAKTSNAKIDIQFLNR